MTENLFDPVAQAREAGASAIDEPIINGPYREPKAYWQVFRATEHGYEQTTPTKVEGRREAGYFVRRTGKVMNPSLLEEDFFPLTTVNEIRARVRQWREAGYPGPLSQVTRRLLEQWSPENPDRSNPMFYCQREAVETVIWLHESFPQDRAGLMVEVYDAESGDLVKVPLSQAHEAFTRYCCKMATGTGKTIVMSMLLAWSVLNKLHDPRATWCSDAVLIVAPGLTVKERLRVLLPTEKGNYYDQFELVPRGLREALSRARIALLHRQEMAVRDDGKKRGVTKLGRESDLAFANRLLKDTLGSKGRLLVLNDEGHHCYRPLPKRTEEKLSKEEEGEIEAAAQWITGLEKIHAARGILSCIDLSATPFYLKGSGYPEGRPFPWVVSDFGLVDAIESGLVKIPQIPVDDNHGKGNEAPAYFHLWRWINERLPKDKKETMRRRAPADAVVPEAEPAINTMIGNWKKSFDAWQEAGSNVPPVLIVVTQDTEISQLLFERLTREDFEFKDFVNRPGQEVTFLYDSKELKKAEEGEKQKDTEARKRAIMNSVGKEGQPGEQVRCIVSVSMLTEGWDANNVTQIVGLRGFTSQLLCEQVVGRALRRRSYEIDPETGMLRPEYADVYGVPFQVIPVKARKGGVMMNPPMTTLVQSLKERQLEHEIIFPRVEGYVSEIRERVSVDWSRVRGLRVGKDSEPTEVFVQGLVGMRIGRPDRSSVGRIDRHDRMPYYLASRVQASIFRMASELAALRVVGDTDEAIQRRRRLFPQFLEIVRKYVGEYVVFDQARPEELGMLKWQQRVVNVLNEAIGEQGAYGEPVILPRIERYRPEGSTSEVMFRAGRPCVGTVKSHISHVVLDSVGWENTCRQVLEDCPLVQTYSRNDHLDFSIPYIDAAGTSRLHMPDFLVRLTSGLLVALELKGYERDLDKSKISAGYKWADAVNRYYGGRRWAYHACFDPNKLSAELQAL